jgi:hypothetical protein
MTLIRIEPCTGSTEPLPIQTAYYFKKADSDTFLIMYVLPETERGVSWINKATDLWVYGPRIKKFFKASKEELFQTPVYLGMNTFDRPLANDYEALSMEEAKIKNIRTHRLVLKARQSTKRPSITSLWVEQNYLIPIKLQYGSPDGKSGFTLYFYKWAKIDTWYFPTTIFIGNENKNSGSYLLRLGNTRANILPDFIFTRAFCEFVTD